MDKLDMTERDELIDRLHEEVSQGNYYEAKLIAEVISAKAKQFKHDNSLAIA